MAQKTAEDSVDGPPKVPGYRKILTSYVQPERGKTVWERTQIEYQPEGYSAQELNRLDYTDFRDLFEVTSRSKDRETKLARSEMRHLGISGLTTSELWNVVRSERGAHIRSKAFCELLCRDSQEQLNLSSFVIEELSRDDLQPSWCNTLIFATEHLEFLDAGYRQRLRQRLAYLAAALCSQWHPRSRLAQEAAVRRFGSLIDNKADIGEVLQFLSTDYPIKVRLIALHSVHRAFYAAPPSASVRCALADLRGELQRMVDYFFRGETLARSDEDFDLGLTALEALVSVGDPLDQQVISRIEGIGKAWVVKQLTQFLTETLTVWSKSDPSTSSETTSVVREAVSALRSIQRE